MTALEQAYFPPGRREVSERRRRDLRSVFAGETGQRVLADLCALCHPLDHSPCGDALSTAQDRGRKEITALLWRYGADTAGFSGADAIDEGAGG